MAGRCSEGYAFLLLGVILASVPTPLESGGISFILPSHSSFGQCIPGLLRSGSQICGRSVLRSSGIGMMVTACTNKSELLQSELLRVAAAVPPRCPECYDDVVFPASGKRPKFCHCGARLEAAEVRHWTDKEARRLQFRNIDLGVSSCGVCSVLSSLAMIGKVKRWTPETELLVARLAPLVRKRACDVAGTCCRYTSIRRSSRCDVGLMDLLVGRSECGSSGSEALIAAVQSALPDVVGAAVEIGDSLPLPQGEVLYWMAGWMRDGAALTVTYNRQKAVGGNEEMPDCWHAQAVYSVNLVERTVGLTNPKREVHEDDFLASLPSPAVLMVRGNEVLMHAANMTDQEIADVEWPNKLWGEMRVTEQVMGLRGRCAGDEWPDAREEFVTVPYAGTGEGVGPCIRIFARRGTRAGDRIEAASGGVAADGGAARGVERAQRGETLSGEGSAQA